MLECEWAGEFVSVWADDVVYVLGVVTDNFVADFEGGEWDVIFFEVGVVLGVDGHPFTV